MKCSMQYILDKNMYFEFGYLCGCRKGSLQGVYTCLIRSAPVTESPCYSHYPSSIQDMLAPSQRITLRIYTLRIYGLFTILSAFWTSTRGHLQLQDIYIRCLCIQQQFIFYYDMCFRGLLKSHMRQSAWNGEGVSIG